MLFNRNFRLIGVICLWICCNVIHAQSISFNHLSLEQGLSHHSVLSITQDSRGFIWLGTREGLNRYDGVRFRIYKNILNDTTSLSQNIVNAVFFDSKKTLWVGTEDGLNMYNQRKDAFERIQQINGHRIGNINCIYEDSKGRIWVGSHSGLHLLTDRKKKQFQSFYASDAGIAGNIVKAVCEGRNGAIWVGTENGLTRMQWQNGHYRFETFRHEAGNPSSLSTNYIKVIVKDSLNQLWIGTQDAGVNLYNPDHDAFTRYLHNDGDISSLVNNNIRNILLIKNKIWVGTDQGLSIIDPVTKIIRSYQHHAADKNSLSNNVIYGLFEDRNGTVWVGTYFGGVDYSVATPFRTIQSNGNQSGLSNNVVTGIAEDQQHNLWIGTDGGGLNYFNRTSGQITFYKHKSNDPTSLGSNLVKSVYVDREGNPWIGTLGGGLCVLNRNTGQFKRYLYEKIDSLSTMGESTSLAEDDEGRMWVAGNSPLKVFRKSGTNLQPLNMEKVAPGMPRDWIASILFKDSCGNIWVGSTFPGIYMISRDSNTVIFVSDRIANCFGEDKNGEIWIGLHNGGVAKYDRKKNRLIYYGADQGIGNMNVIGLLTDSSGNIWLSTDNGLVKFTPDLNRFQTYSVSDGLAGNEFNYNAFFKDSRGELFFGGFNGVTSFFPDQIETNGYIAPVVFTGLKLFNSEVGVDDQTKLLNENIGVTKELVFNHNQNVFTIEFALLNFIRPNKNKYAYKLEGVHNEWTVVSTPSVTFTNLPAGNYNLLVKGANNDGMWSEPVSMKLVVLPPLWKTGWAYLLYAFLIASIIFLVVRFFYLRALLNREQELHNLKLNFFTNISHEIRTHLTLIMAPIEKIQQENTGNSILTHHLKNVRHNANRLLTLVTELMDFRRADSKHLKLHIAGYNLIDFLNEIYTSFEEVSLVNNISLSFVHDTNAVQLFFDKEQMGKVIYNLLTNAFKFTPEGGRICLHMENMEDKVRIHVVDNGRGIAPQYADKLFTSYFQADDTNSQNTGYGIGLALSKIIVELHKGTLTAESHPAKDKESITRFTITLLKGERHFEGTQQVRHNAEDERKGNITEQQALHTVPETPNDEAEPKQYHVLIVEDNKDVKDLIKDTLNNYKITECANGADGLQASLEQIPDLIISDVMMPEMDGLELCHKLKSDERTSHIPVILLTAKSSQNDHVSGLNTGADVYLTKPFSTQVLNLSVKNLLAAREKMRQKFSKEFVLGPRSRTVNTIDEQFLDKLIGIIEESMSIPEFGVEFLSKEVAMSQSVLYKKVKALTDMSVNDFAKNIRLKKAAQLLQQNFTIIDVSIMTGFGNRKYFSKEFKKQFGMPPSEFIRTDSGDGD